MDIPVQMESDMSQQTKAQPQIQVGLMAAKEITETVKISRAHLYNMVARGAFPKPALHCGPRYTRWQANDVYAWLSDPQGWIEANKNTAAIEAAL